MKAFHNIRHSSLLEYINSKSQSPTSEFSLAEKGFVADSLPCSSDNIPATHPDYEREAADRPIPNHWKITPGSIPEAVPSSPLQPLGSRAPGAHSSPLSDSLPLATDAPYRLDDMTPACQAPAPAVTGAVTAEPPALPGAGLWPLPEPAEPPPLNMTRHIVLSPADPFRDDWLHW